MSKPRRTELKRKQRRKHKLALLRQQFAAAKSPATREAILKKLAKVAPTVSEKEFAKRN